MNVAAMEEIVEACIPRMTATGLMSGLRGDIRSTDKGKAVVFKALANTMLKDRQFKLTASGKVYEFNFMNEWEKTPDALKLASKIKARLAKRVADRERRKAAKGVKSVKTAAEPESMPPSETPAEVPADEAVEDAEPLRMVDESV